MSTAANHTTRASHSSPVPAVEETSYLRCPEGRIGYDVAGAGSITTGAVLRFLESVTGRA
jgi:hypothetical protein